MAVIRHGIGRRPADHAQEAPHGLIAVARGAAMRAAPCREGVAGDPHGRREGLDRRRQCLPEETHLVEDIGDSGRVDPCVPPGQRVAAP